MRLNTKKCLQIQEATNFNTKRNELSNTHHQRKSSERKPQNVCAAPKPNCPESIGFQLHNELSLKFHSKIEIFTDFCFSFCQSFYLMTL